MNFEHKPVLLWECIKNLKIRPEGIYVDGTFGGGGHSQEILKQLTTGKLVAFDQDIDAIINGQRIKEKYPDQLLLVHSNFRNIKEALKRLAIDAIDGMLIDLGVSSYQLDTPDRGFSYINDAKLDMRMDNRQGLSAYDVVNQYSKEDLSKIIRDYGEENWHSRIAEFICEKRKEKPIESTFELVEIIKAAVPKGARDENLHPAKRTFQGIRIEVNQELAIIEQTIEDAVSMLKMGGVIEVITFHSLEDRIVKNCFKNMAKNCVCPPEIPICMCKQEAKLKIMNKKPIVASEEELEENPRSRSAKLRCAMRV